MNAVRTLLSMPALLGALSAVTLIGCYDLSDPTGPRRNDFVRAQGPTQTQEQGQTQAEDDSDESCSAAPCSANKAAMLDLDAPAPPPTPAAGAGAAARAGAAAGDDAIDPTRKVRVPGSE